MTSGIELAMALLRREELKREIPQQAQNVWSKRLPIIDMKRNFASLGSKEDDELLVDKERVSKRAKFEPKYELPSFSANLLLNLSRLVGSASNYGLPTMSLHPRSSLIL
jgi:hypothetical protein